MNTSTDPTIRALNLLRFDGEPEPHVVHRTQEMLMQTHARSLLPSRSARRLWLGGAFLAALGVGAAASPRVLDWWEGIHTVVDEPSADGSRHVVLADDAGNTVLDTTLAADEALFQIQNEDGTPGPLLTVTPLEKPLEQPAPAPASDPR